MTYRYDKQMAKAIWTMRVIGVADVLTMVVCAKLYPSQSWLALLILGLFGFMDVALAETLAWAKRNGLPIE